MRSFLSLLFILLIFLSCSETKNQLRESNSIENTKINNWTPPVPGQVIAEYKERITDDKINDSYFLVQILSTDISKDGLFDLVLGFGQNLNNTTLELPKWNDETILKPVIKKGEKEFQCYIGFEAGDSLFHELYKVSVQDKNIRLKQTKAYSLSNY